MKKLKSIYLTPFFFVTLAGVIVAFILSYAVSLLFPIVCMLGILLAALLIVDLILLYRQDGIIGSRITPRRMSNGDNNDIVISISNNHPFTSWITVIDEVPQIFQMRDNSWKTVINGGEKKLLTYGLTPKKRGAYDFGNLNVYASTPIRFIARRYTFDSSAVAKVYPSFLQMRQYEIAAFKNNLEDRGMKKVKKLGQSTEFDQIKSYVLGDDPRTINWKASARRNALMVNQYQDEKSQQVYCIIDKGRTMRAPFDGLSMLDYAINASLALSNIAVKKEDKVGLITYSHKLSTFLKASNRYVQIHQILETLHNQKTRYLESNYELMHTVVSRNITQRSLLVLFTNFDSNHAFKRQLRYLKSLSRKHLVAVVFFENTGLRSLLDSDSTSLRTIHHRAIAEQSALEKQLMLKSLKRLGIIGILSPPKNLTVNTLNTYLDIKARNLI